MHGISQTELYETDSLSQNDETQLYPFYIPTPTCSSTNTQDSFSELICFLHVTIVHYCHTRAGHVKWKVDDGISQTELCETHSSEQSECQ